MRPQPPVIPKQTVPANQLAKGDIILFIGGAKESVRKVQPVKGNKLLVCTAEHPDGILAKHNQSITIVPR